MCQGAGCNDPIQIDIPIQTPGQDGTSAYIYSASASSITGTGFTYPANPAQAFRAILNTNTPISSPIASNFTGLWFKAIGADGTNGTGTNGLDGISAGFEYKFLNYGINTNPGSGYVSTNGVNFSLTNILNVAYLDNTAVNIQAVLTALNTSSSNTKAIIKLTKKTDESKFVVFSLNVASDTGTYYALNVNYLSSSTVTAFVANDLIQLEIYLTGSKGDKGDTGPAGAFIIGTIGAGVQQYPAVASAGSAFRCTGNGTISDNALGVSNVKRFYTNDVLYCHTDTTLSDGSNYFIWIGFPRSFIPATGVDSFVHNTANAGTANGNASLAHNNGSVASGNNANAFSGGVASGMSSLAIQGSASGIEAVAIGANSIASGDQSTALGNGAAARALASVATGYFSDINASADAAFNAAALGQTGAGGKYSSSIGKSARADFQGETVIGHGEFDVNQRGQSQTRIIPQVNVTSNATPTVLGYLPGVPGSLTLPTKSVWSISGSIVAVKVSTGEVANWFFKGLVKNPSGTASIVDNILYLDPATGTYITTSTQFAQDAALSTAALALSVSSSNLVLTVTGIAATTIRWSGTVQVEQITCP